MGNMIDRYGVRKTLAAATAALMAAAGVLMPLSNDLYHTLAVVTAFTISYTLICIALHSRMLDIMGESKVAITGAIATFKDLEYTIGPLMAGVLMLFLSLQSISLAMGAALVLLVPVALLLHD